MPLWWDKKYGKESKCAITLTRLRPGKNKNKIPYSIFLHCGHGFNRNALMNMIKFKYGEIHKCPLCRANFQIRNII